MTELEYVQKLKSYDKERQAMYEAEDTAYVKYKPFKTAQEQAHTAYQAECKPTRDAYYRHIHKLSEKLNKSNETDKNRLMLWNEVKALLDANKDETYHIIGDHCVFLPPTGDGHITRYKNMSVFRLQKLLKWLKKR